MCFVVVSGAGVVAGAAVVVVAGAAVVAVVGGGVQPSTNRKSRIFFQLNAIFSVSDQLGHKKERNSAMGQILRIFTSNDSHLKLQVS